MQRSIWLIPVVALAAACSEPNGIDVRRQMDFTAYTCPDSFSLVGVIFDKEKPNEDDANLDGWVCEMKFEDEAGTVHYVTIDNNVPASAKGSCPAPFVVWAAKQGEGADRNANGIVCVLQHKNGESVVDDNYKGGGS